MAQHEDHFSPCSTFSIICHCSQTNRQAHILQISFPSSVKLVSRGNKIKKEEVSLCFSIGKKNSKRLMMMGVSIETAARVQLLSYH